MKKIGILIIALALLTVLSACGCEHEWKDAACGVPKTCTLCGEVEGEPGDHTWQDATCDAPKTCALCAATEGEKLEHRWAEENCIIACTLCSAESADSPVHMWQEATCTAPKTCTKCAVTEGDPLGHDWAEADCDSAKQCKVCDTYDGAELGHTLGDGSDGVSGVCTVCGKAVEYHNEGTAYGWTTYEIAADGSYTNPVTYLVAEEKDDRGYPRYQAIQWYDNGELKHHHSMYAADDQQKPCALYTAYCVDGKVYYFNGYTYSDDMASAMASTRMLDAAMPYVKFVGSHSSANNPTYQELYDERDNGTVVTGYIDAAYDCHGNPYVIVYNAETDVVRAVVCDWRE